ncbi:hypothetical protein GN244_ATG19951 [Phytophthora infestans]|uniref:Uncharacterized protein n=1 Tax=Phytophthora infestans TaxID=4787 RepID=A0A833RY50_PHYIN|nr:hypothetical protein GN244_ATG19951 [Phytophthora infestans]
MAFNETASDEEEAVAGRRNLDTAFNEAENDSVLSETGDDRRNNSDIQGSSRVNEADAPRVEGADILYHFSSRLPNDDGEDDKTSEDDLDAVDVDLPVPRSEDLMMTSYRPLVV